MAYKVINLKDIYKSLGEESTKDIIKDFECELNPDVEYFIREKAKELVSLLERVNELIQSLRTIDVKL